MNVDNVNSCIESIKAFPWGDLSGETPGDLATQMHEQLQKIADRTIPWKTFKKRSTDDPWINDPIRKKCKQRRAVYRDRGRDSDDYRELREKTDDMISNAKKDWYDGEAEKLMTRGANQVAYKALDDLGTTERSSKRWNVLDLRPGKTEKDLADELADYYSTISREFPPLTKKDVPTTYDRVINEINQDLVCERLKQLKKPKSHVSIDLPNKIVNATACPRY